MYWVIYVIYIYVNLNFKSANNMSYSILYYVSYSLSYIWKEFLENIIPILFN